LTLPRAAMWSLGAARSRIGQLKHTQRTWLRRLATKPPISWADRRASRFRYIGDYDAAFRQGLLHVLADSSQVYGRIFAQRRMPTLYVPWGSAPSAYDDLHLERDIDVLWMGTRGTRRRSVLLDRVRRQLRSRGVEIYVADNQENPFIFGETRTRFLNRAKVTLNITRTWYDDNFSRFAYAVPNRSLVISEPLLPHCPEFEPGIHYVSAPIDKLADTVVYYLTHSDERQRIVEAAYRLITTELTFRDSIARLMDGVTKVRIQSAPASGLVAAFQEERIQG
ncbi:MAG: glycosyltransferase family 1 protein, partial [Anaerolineae bacterium]|nr:glycosyltransferase family 1 protein [Anaerolineae bacterium]